ncbi:MAG: hypothetical protein Q4F88_03080 [Eubacteriales bacterium]|nr:hypothetical protein [Eubacteriales bacterium]
MVDNKNYNFKDKQNDLSNKDEDSCKLQDMNCLGDEEKDCSITDMNCNKDDEDKSCGITNMNCQ